MEKIVYRKTLDVHKNGIQFTLQGFETADNMTRKIEINLMASGDTIDLPLEQLEALMYVTTPNAKEPSINKCTIKDNTIIYDVLPIGEEGITEMQLKLIDARPDGANGVLPSPKFAIEVSKSNTDDDGAVQTTTYTALEDAIAKAKGVYDARFLRIEIDNDCTFRCYYADGVVYETDMLYKALYNGNALLSQSFARGDSGIRPGEEADNSLHYSNVSRSASEEANRVSGEATDLLEEVTKHGVYTAFSVDFETGEVKYISPSYKFNINKENGKLEAVGEAYNPEDAIELMVTEWLTNTTKGVDNSINEMNSKLSNLATKEYVEKEIATFDFIKVVDTLPETGLPNRIYLVPRQEADANNLFDEYIWANESWEFITTKFVEVDLTNYVTKDTDNGLITIGTSEEPPADTNTLFYVQY